MRMHASCVAMKGRAVLILGRSGSGKSALALQLMAYGADLVADDRVQLHCDTGKLFATAGRKPSGMIEARQVGILSVEPVERGLVVMAVDLDHIETVRLPPDRFMDLLGVQVPLLHNVDSPYFAAAVLQYLKSGKADY
jgi:HPr kinase/phosphorylase